MRTNKGAVAGMLLAGALALTPPLRADERPKEEPRKPLRALLFADAATRELQFLRAQLLRDEAQKAAEVWQYLQSAQGQADPNLAGGRSLKAFPAELSAFDVIVAFDPDWSELTAENAAALKKWIDGGGGLIVVAGPVNTLQLGRPKVAEALKPVLDVLPVVLDDNRLIPINRDNAKPTRLTFPKADALPLKLDGEGEGALAGWELFFTGKAEAEKGAEVVRGFYGYYPVRSVKAAGVVAAAYDDPGIRLKDGQNQPFLVVGKFGKGRVVYLSSGETWRLRAYRTAYHERLWASLVGHAAGR
jgi:hypothetical protein